MNPYETSANAPYIKQANEARKVIEEQLAFNRENYFTQFRDHVYTPKKDNDRLGYWAHPIVIKDMVIVDTRSFLRNNGEVNNAVEHRLCLERAIMEYFWQTDPAIYEGISDVLTITYSEWVSSSICARYGAGEVDRTRFIVAAAAYMLFTIYERFKDASGRNIYYDVDSILRTMLVRKLGLPANFISDVLADFPIDLKTTETFKLPTLASVIAQLSTTHLGKFDHTVLMQLVGGGSWLGANATLHAITAVEHPPSFAVLLKNAVDISTYKNKTRIGRAANAVARKVNVEVVVRTVNGLMSDYVLYQ